MFYKIVDKKSKAYKALHALRREERKTSSQNLKKIKEKLQLPFNWVLGDNSQQSFNRVPTYIGFEFLEPEKLPKSVWKQHKEHPSIYIPNLRTKKGKEIQAFLDGLPNSDFMRVFRAIGLEDEFPARRFKLPYLEIVGDIVLLYFDDSYDLQSKFPDIKEITSREFEIIRTSEGTKKVEAAS